MLVFELCKVLVTQNLEASDESLERLLAGTLDPPSGRPGILDVPDRDVATRLLPFLDSVETRVGRGAEPW